MVGIDRACYLRLHLELVRRAVRAGVPLLAYICWSITSNREWGLPFDGGSDFGLYHVELDTDPTCAGARPSAIERPPGSG